MPSCRMIMERRLTRELLLSTAMGGTSAKMVSRSRVPKSMPAFAVILPSSPKRQGAFASYYRSMRRIREIIAEK